MITLHARLEMMRRRTISAATDHASGLNCLSSWLLLPTMVDWPLPQI